MDGTAQEADQPLLIQLREAHRRLDEQEQKLFLAATVGQQLVGANQRLQDELAQQRQHSADEAERQWMRTHAQPLRA
ncbi:hypothetical protein EV174_005956, partial [Coemansia sp. RSA 2320]